MNLYARFAALARYQPAKVAIETAQTTLTYAELDRLARQFARRLSESGVVAGDVVAVRMRETPDHIAAMFGIMHAGAVLLPLDWRGTRPEFDRVVARFAPRAAITDDKATAGWYPSAIHGAAAREADPDDRPPADLTDAPLFYSLTSGTTGEPKAVIVTHEQLLARVTNRAVEGMFLPDDRFLNTLALAFTAGREHTISAILIGATLALFPLLFDPQELISFVNDRAITSLNLSPNVSRALLGTEQASDNKLLMPHLRVLISTTGKLQPEERAGLRKRVAPRLIDYYGATAVGLIAVLAREEDEADPTAVGRPAIGVDVEIADDAGAPVAPGGLGRIRVRGPAVASPMPGPAGDDDEGFRDGWFYPGDLGKFGPDGILHLHGRGADLIKRGGLMVHAQEVEQALRRHANVADAAVVGAPSIDLGQEVVAFIVANGTIEQKELVRHCRGELAPFKVPARFIFVDSLPTNPNGKVVKAELLKTL